MLQKNDKQPDGLPTVATCTAEAIGTLSFRTPRRLTPLAADELTEEFSASCATLPPAAVEGTGGPPT